MGEARRRKERGDYPRTDKRQEVGHSASPRRYWLAEKREAMRVLVDGSRYLATDAGPWRRLRVSSGGEWVARQRSKASPRQRRKARAAARLAA